LQENVHLFVKKKTRIASKLLHTTLINIQYDPKMKKFSKQNFIYQRSIIKSYLELELAVNLSPIRQSLRIANRINSKPTFSKKFNTVSDHYMFSVLTFVKKL
jgi:hypothetical protein